MEGAVYHDLKRKAKWSVPLFGTDYRVLGFIFQLYIKIQIEIFNSEFGTS